MSEVATPKTLALRDALKRWGNRALITQIKTAERQFSEFELTGFGRPLLLSARERNAALSKPAHEDELRRRKLDDAWDAADRDFKVRVERNKIYLRGVPVTDEKNAGPQAIDGQWATIIIFDYLNNKFKLRLTRYVAIAGSLTPFPDAQQDASRSPTRVVPNAVNDGAPVSAEPKRRRGRPIFPITEFTELAKTRPRAGNNKRTAELLLGAFRNIYPDLIAPAHRTVVDYVPAIYAQIGPVRTR